MNDFITLTCPSCGGKLEIKEDIQQFACAHCGTEHRVNRGSSIISLTPLVEGVKNLQVGVDKTASELAIKRLKDDIALLEKEYARDYASRGGLVMPMAGWGVIGLVGIFPIFMGIQSGEIIPIGGGILIAGFSFFRVYINYIKRINLSENMAIKLKEAQKKTKELKKHQEKVDG